MPRLLIRFLVAIVMVVPLAGPMTAAAQLRATPIASGFDRPLGIVPHPTSPATFIVWEQAGRVRVVRNGAIEATDFVDLRGEIASGGEQGLLGVAFSPDFAASGRVFFSFTNRAGDSVIARMTRIGNDGLRVDSASRFDLRWPDGQRVIEQPFTNHNGGNIIFGPEGYLYIGLGDGGSGNDPMHRAQDPASLLGKMLRIDVSVPDNDPEGYNVPPGNPFAGRGDVLHEIWAFGLRNPWRWSFDDRLPGATGAMLIADVGQGSWEEINYEPEGAGGRNYGWRIREGAHNNVTNRAPFSEPLRDPIWEYARGEGRSTTGGFVYRGQGLGAAYVGRYFFADFVTSRVWSIRLTVDPATRDAVGSDITEHTAELGAAAASVTSFGRDTAGELYLVGYGGAIFRIDGPGDPGGPPSGPRAPNRPYDGPPIGKARPRPGAGS